MDQVSIASVVKESSHEVPNAHGFLPERTEEGKNPFALPEEDEFRCQVVWKKLLNKGVEGVPVWKRPSKNNAGSSSSLRPSFRKLKSLNHRKDDGSAVKSERKDQDKAAALRSGSTPAAAKICAGSLVVERSEKESIHDLLSKKREIFFMRMNIENKREDIRNLNERARKEEEEIVKSRQNLEDEAKQFEITVKVTHNKAHDAVKNAEYVTQLRKDKFMEAEELRKEIEAIQKESDENKKALDRSLQYKAFLDELTLKSWLDQKNHMKEQQFQGQHQHQQHQHPHQKAKNHEVSGNQDSSSITIVVPNMGNAMDSHDENEYEQRSGCNGRTRCRKMVGGTSFEGASSSIVCNGRKIDCRHLKNSIDHHTLELSGKSNLVSNDNNIDEELSSTLCFTDPQQLLEILHIMEEQNLYLIQNKQEIEQALDKHKHNFEELKQTMEAQTESLAMQIDHLESLISQEQSSVDQLKQDMIALMKDSACKQDLVTCLRAEVSNIYESCRFDYVTTPTTLFMLGDLEARLEDLLASTARMPAVHIMKAKKERQKKKRQLKRSQLEAIQKSLQEERNRKAMERNQQVANKAMMMAARNKLVKSSFQPIQRKNNTHDSCRREKVLTKESAAGADELKYL